MEPFGLLHFLQTLLPPAPTETQNAPPPQKAESPPQNENASPKSQQTEETPTENQAAFLHFMERHEHRAKRLRPKK